MKTKLNEATRERPPKHCTHCNDRMTYHEPEGSSIWANWTCPTGLRQTREEHGGGSVIGLLHRHVSKPKEPSLTAPKKPTKLRLIDLMTPKQREAFVAAGGIA